MSTSTYVAFGDIAERKTAEYIAEKQRTGTPLPKKMPDFAYRGIHVQRFGTTLAIDG
eukprot:gene22319-28437_t